jgi:queuine tRNA-ribosyltransferase
MPLILAPRRYPAIPCPPNNTDTSIAILTSVGFRQLPAHQYLDSVRSLKPDIAIGLADIVYGREPGVKRRAKMVDRTHAFTQDALERLYGKAVPAEQKASAAYFAPVLPLDNAQQSLYLDDLQDELKSRISGLALYESASLSQIPESLGALPRLLLSQPGSPHDLLREVSLGGDLMTLPFVGECSDAGIALDFTFPAPSDATVSASEPRALGIDLWSADNAKDVSALSEGCECYACRKHHRAYFNHLLNAKEMAAWALLQMHNYHVMDLFFAGVRDSIQRGTFEEDMRSFTRVYAPELPQRTGEGPRYVDSP